LVLGGVWNDLGGNTVATNSTVSGNNARFLVSSIYNDGTLTLTSSTVSTSEEDLTSGILNTGAMTAMNSLFAAECDGGITSGGYNIESPGDTCSFDEVTDLVDLNADDLNLGELADNGGPTMTHALLTVPVVSAAIDKIPTEGCVDSDGLPLTADQRGFTRPVAILGSEPRCDVGAFEVQGDE